MFYVYLTPGASITCINGLYHNNVNLLSIKIAVHGKPIENRANIDLVKFISEKFDLPKSRVKIISGQKSRHKKILLSKYTVNNIPREVQDFLKNELSSIPKTLFS